MFSIGKFVPGLEEVVDEVLKARSAGSPTDEAVRWTDLVLVQLAQQVPARAGYRRRSLRKALSTGDVEPHERDRQFQLIATLRRQARARGVIVAGPVIHPVRDQDTRSEMAIIVVINELNIGAVTGMAMGASSPWAPPARPAPVSAMPSPWRGRKIVPSIIHTRSKSC